MNTNMNIDYDYDEYLINCENIRKTNSHLLNLFFDYLKKSEISNKTINRHLSNVDFYINDFLLRIDAYSMPIWQERCAIYNDSDAPNPFFYF